MLKKWIFSLVLHPINDVMAAMGRVMEGARPGRSTAYMVLSLVVSWFIYVPIHELLHVAGCIATGGSVSELQIDWKYGGNILAKYFSFVKVGGDYAGRLTGFDWRGSDWIYLATDFGPFLLTVLLGVPLLLYCGHGRSPLLFGTAVVVGLAPVYQLTGDYYEMGSIVVTRLLTICSGSTDIAFSVVRSDDVFRLFEEVFTRADELGLSSTWRFAGALILIVLSQVMGLFLALFTYALGRRFGTLFVSPARPIAP